MPLSEEHPSGTLISNWLYVHTGLIWANQREVEPRNLEMNGMLDNSITAWLIKRGRLILKEAHGTVTAKENQWVFPSHTTGWRGFQPGSAILSIRFSAEWPTGRPLFDHQNPILIEASEHPELTRAAEALKSVASRVSGRGGFFLVNESNATVEDYFAIRHAFEDWLSAYVNTMRRLGISPSIMSTADPRVLHSTKIIDHHPMHLPLSESELARRVGLSVSQLSRLFSRDLGTSPRKYAERRRLEKAISLLHLHRHSVKEAAAELGFNSLPHFSTWFRRLQGTSPRDYLKRLLRRWHLRLGHETALGLCYYQEMGVGAIGRKMVTASIPRVMGWFGSTLISRWLIVVLGEGLIHSSV